MTAEIIEREIPGPDGGLLVYRDDPHDYHLTSEGGKRRRLTSASTLVRTLDKPALSRRGGWIERNAVVGGYKAARFLKDVPEHKMWERVRELGLGLSVTDERAQGGTIIHEVMDTLAVTGKAPNPATVPEIARPWTQAAVDAWLKLNVQEVVEREGIVCYPELGYAGRFDLLARTGASDALDAGLPSLLTLIDYKSSIKGSVWGEAHFQTRLYAMAIRRTLGLEVESIVIVGLGPDGSSELIQCACSEELALSLLDVYRGRAFIERSMTAQRKAAV